MESKHDEVIRVDKAIAEYISQNPNKTNSEVAAHFNVR